MAHASKKHIGAGSAGKGDGSGALTDMPEDVVPENMVLSNRDKKTHPEGRGLDSKQVQTDQLQDHAASHASSGDADE